MGASEPEPGQPIGAMCSLPGNPLSVTAYARLLSKVSSLDCALPYNWNWQGQWPQVVAFLEQHPLVLMDIGARGDAPPELDSLRRFVRRVGFEPDPEECRRLNESDAGIFFPTLLAGAAGTSKLNLYQDLGYSSIYTLTERYQRLWIGELPIVKTLELPSLTIDTFLTDHADLAPDMIKLDTQGSELDILRGAEGALASVGLVEVEVEFLQMYDEQPLFGDVASFLTGQGFELLYLNRTLVSRRATYQGPSRGQLLFGDALFGKHEDEVGNLSLERRVKYVILLCQYGHLDIAWQLVEQYPEMEELVPGLRSIFRDHRHPALRVLLMQLDKLLALALHSRRYNQRGTDSDRCWPIR